MMSKGVSPINPDTGLGQCWEASIYTEDEGDTSLECSFFAGVKSSFLSSILLLAGCHGLGTKGQHLQSFQISSQEHLLAADLFQTEQAAS